MHNCRLSSKMHRGQWLLPCLLLLLLGTCIAVAEAKHETNITVEMLDPTLPPSLRKESPKCSVQAFYGEFHGPALRSARSSFPQPPGCPAPWTRVVLELSMSAWNTREKSVVASVSVGGGEVLRAATAHAPGATIASWTVRKDVTRYSALLRPGPLRNTTVAVRIGPVGPTFAGMFTANVTIHFFRGGFWDDPDRSTVGPTAHHQSNLIIPVIETNARPSGLSSSVSPSVDALFRHPANLIIPVTTPSGRNFVINSSSRAAKTTLPAIPRNVHRAVLEIFVSYHGEDEQWYTTPLQSSSSYDDEPAKLNGGFRHVYTTMDGRFVGGRIPFPVIYPSSVNPYFWSPVAAIAALDMPSYAFELTPLLQLLLDGRPHALGLGVSSARNYWLLTANLHLWVDHWSDIVTAGLIDYRAPPLILTKNAAWQESGDGSSEVDAEGLVRFVGWVSSSKGNLTVTVRRKVTFKTQVQVQNGGASRQVEMVNKERMMVGVHRGSEVVGRVQVFSEAPLQVQTASEAAAGGAAYERSRLYHGWEEVVNVNDGVRVVTSIVSDRQDAEGAALMSDGAAVWGSGRSSSFYKYRDGLGCYMRSVDADGGAVKVDVQSRSCASHEEA